MVDNDRDPADRGWPLAEIKAALARGGASLAPDARPTMIDKPTEGGAAVVVLDRVRAGFTPDYCTHGYASCVRCNSMCYLGSETSKLVTDRIAFPICIQCAAIVAKPETGAVRLRRVTKDHRRADGPHE